jgi:diphthamide biosynthesis methyltransferase
MKAVDSIGEVNEKGEYQVSEADSKRLFKKFEGFKKKRTLYLEIYKKARLDQYKQAEDDYKPKIDEKSRKMVEKKQQQSTL